MGTEGKTPPEGFTSVDSSPDGAENRFDERELNPGDEWTVRVLDIREGEGEHGPWYRLRCQETDGDGEVFDYFAEDGCKAAVTNERISEGDVVWIGKDDIPKEYDIDGKTGEYHPVVCAVGGA